MVAHKQIEELLKVSGLNKKKADLLLGQIIANICFSFMKEVSEYIYKERATRQAEYNSYCDSIFTEIAISIKNAHKCGTFEEFHSKIMSPIYSVRVIVNNLADKYDFIQNNCDDLELLINLKEESEQIYKKFFKRAPRKRKVKAHGNK